MLDGPPQSCSNHRTVRRPDLKPLERMRPATLDKIVGQQRLLVEGTPLRRRSRPATSIR
jgi:replication-associated recombination protein RarA